MMTGESDASSRAISADRVMTPARAVGGCNRWPSGAYEPVAGRRVPRAGALDPLQPSPTSNESTRRSQRGRSQSQERSTPASANPRFRATTRRGAARSGRPRCGMHLAGRSSARSPQRHGGAGAAHLIRRVDHQVSVRLVDPQMHRSPAVGSSSRATARPSGRVPGRRKPCPARIDPIGRGLDEVRGVASTGTMSVAVGTCRVEQLGGRNSQCPAVDRSRVQREVGMEARRRTEPVRCRC